MGACGPNLHQVVAMRVTSVKLAVIFFRRKVGDLCADELSSSDCGCVG